MLPGRCLVAGYYMETALAKGQPRVSVTRLLQLRRDVVAVLGNFDERQH